MDILDEQTKSIIEKEIVEALSTYRTQYTLLTQIVTVILVANVSIIGFAMTTNKLDLLFIGAFCPILILFVRAKSEQLTLPIVYVAYHLEQKLNHGNIDFLATTFLATTYTSSFKLIKKIESKGTNEERIRELQRLIKSQYFSIFNQSNLLITLICICATFIQLFLKCIL